jgi:hypothetical protein
MNDIRMNCDIGTGHSKSESVKKSLQEETGVALLQRFSLKQAQGPLVSGPVCLHSKPHPGIERWVQYLFCTALRFQ